MLKPILILTLCLLFCNTIIAQQKPFIYYLKKSGKIVSVKDSADYFLEILAPDTNIDKNLFGVREFYLSGKIRLMSSTSDNTANFKLQGPCVTFFPNGNRMRINKYEKGEPVGDEIEYYPNGRLYDAKTYSADKKIFLKQCNDSTGIVLAKNGSGKWITFFDDSFSKAYAEGQVIDSLQDGEWSGKFNDSVTLRCTYKKGSVITSSANDKTGTEHIFKSDEIGTEARSSTGEILKSSLRYVHYPARAIENGTQGIVWVNFIVEKDGTLSNIKVKRGIGDGCDEEAIRIIKNSPYHSSLHLHGIPVRVVCSVPVSFTLSSE